MLSLVAAIVLLAPELPPECQAPPTRDVTTLTGFAQSSGSLSVGLDSVATWCFDSGGTWTGGQRPAKGKKPTSTEPTGDCAKAIVACEAARASISPESKALLVDALGDLERPFLGVKYKPKRSGLAERPPEVAECGARDRSTLFSHAQARMDLARLASQVQSEYANYKTWLFAEGLKCAQAVARGEKDVTRKGIAVDTPVQGGGTQQVPTSPLSPAGERVGERADAGSNGTITATTSPSSPTPSLSPAGERAGVRADAGSSATITAMISPTSATSPPSPAGERAGVRGDAGSPASGAVAPTSGSSTSVATTGLATSTAGAQADAGAAGSALSPTLSPPGERGAVGGVGSALSPTLSPSGERGTVGASGSALTPTLSPTGERGAVTSATVLPVGGPTAERERALSSSLLDKWRYFLAEQMKIEQDPDWVSGFLASRELRDCRCVRPIPGELVRRLENKDRIPALEADDEKNTRCELCLLDVYPAWKQRVTKQCALALELTEFELGYLQRSDDGNGLPPRCLDAAKAKLGGKPVTPTVTAGTARPAQPTGPKGNAAFIITKAPDALPPTQGETLKPLDHAPMPEREHGRVYVRIFTSATCAAEVLPGPIHARTGDLLPLPPGIREVVVRGPCGGFAEVYLGKEEKPRVSESFPRDNVALRLRLAP